MCIIKRPTDHLLYSKYNHIANINLLAKQDVSSFTCLHRIVCLQLDQMLLFTVSIHSRPRRCVTRVYFSNFYADRAVDSAQQDAVMPSTVVHLLR